jgi:hypothetical protein
VTRKRSDALDAVFTLASVWLAFRGESAESISARALAAARAAEETRRRLERFVMGRVRETMDCRKPAACNCLVCSSGYQEPKPENLS